MKRTITSLFGTAVAVFGAMVLLAPRADAQCLGDCNGNGTVTSGELTKITAITIQCIPAAATGCAAVPGGCPAADKNGNGIISAGELTNVISNILNFPNGCPPGGATPTPTNTPVQPTNTVPANTPTHTATRTASPTPTAGAVCGNGLKEGDEDCDDGGICIGGSNAGTVCNSESTCLGNGVCESGPHIGASCPDNAACGTGNRCVHCKTFGGDGCAANCTGESNIPFNLVAGVAVKLCVGGDKVGMECTSNTQCTGGGTCSNPVVRAGTSGAFVHDGIIQLPLALSGSQVTTAGHPRSSGADGGLVPFVVKATSVKIDRIKVGALACACVRGIPPKTCGGTLFDADGVTFTTNCTPQYTAGESLCAGKNLPCTFVNGPGNSGAGIIGCNGLQGVDLSFTQTSSLVSHPPPPPPTPPPGSTLPVIALSGSGPSGSVVVINSSAIGTTTMAHKPGDVCTGVATPGPTPKCDPASDFGADCAFCTDDDPQSSRGTANPLPQVSGTAFAEIFMTSATTQPDHNIGPYTVSGVPIDCSKLSGPSPSLSGETIVGAFTALNQPATNDIVVTNVFIAQ